MPKVRSVTAARRELPSLLRSAERGEVVEITRHGKTVAVLVSTRDYRVSNRRTPDLSDAIRGFRRRFDLRELRIEDIYRGVRDRGAGREVAL